MATRSFQTRLLELFVGVLLLLQVTTMVSVYLAGERTLQRSVAAELRVGARVLDRLLSTRGRQLSESLRVLALDFAFREAVASGDRPTITSVLENHGSRISADLVVLVDLNGSVIADTLDGRMTARPFPFPGLLRTARSVGEASGTVAVSGRPYQLVIVPVLAPRPIAWVCAGFEINQSVLQDVLRLTAVEVSLWSNGIGQSAQLVSTLPADERNDLAVRLRQLVVLAGATDSTVNLGSSRYATLIEPLQTADNSRVQVVVQRSLEDARRPFMTLQWQIVGLSSIALLVAVIAAMFFSGTVTRPLRVLVEGAERIQQGQYVSPVVVQQHDELGHLATAFNEMQSAIAAREDQIVHQATHDALTGLPNRTLFIDRLSQAIVASRRSGEAVGMLMMDLNRFKEINDTLGHHFGDELLIEIGRRLAHTLRESDTVARLGGDEFAVKFRARELSEATVLAKRVSAAFAAPFVLGEISIEVNASVGIALYPLHAEDADSLMKRADIAMYDAKKNHAPMAIYEAGRDEHSLRRLSLMMELRQAIARDELKLHFQPKIDLRTERAVHAEALVRWIHPQHGLLRPDEFVPLAEHSGNISLITKWVLRSAIAQCARWNASSIPLTIAVNLSAADLFDSELPTFITGLLAEEGVPPSRLVLEITESAVMKDPRYGMRILADLKSRGISMAIDDFGTGHSSLAQLKKLPVDELKIDKSFVQNLAESAQDDLVIVRSTIELGHSMGMIVVAEGVENLEALRILQRFGCDMAQGYYMSRPLPVSEFEEWLRTSPFGHRAEDAAVSI